MLSLLNLVLLILPALAGMWLYNGYQNKKRLKKQEQDELNGKIGKEDEALAIFYNNRLQSINSARIEFAKLLSLENGFFSQSQERKWLEKYQILHQDISFQPPKSGVLTSDSESNVKSFIDIYQNANVKRAYSNKSFIQNELTVYGHFFDNIEGRKLDLQQRVAIITDEDNSIIIAGAGSGKTTTIVGKVNYVLDRYKISPSQILLISFTSKSALTLSQRIKNDKIEVKTFHKLGKDIIATAEGRQPSIYDQAQFNTFIKRCFIELLKNPDYIEKVVTYFTDFLKPPKTQFEFENHGEYIQYVKDQNFRSYKQIPVGPIGTKTYRQEIVKSIEECKIANFLFFNSIDYHYEKRYEIETANEIYSQYKPDFTVVQGGKTLYIEHFAVSKTGDVPHFFANQGISYQEAKDKYWSKINWARETHAANKTTMIETFSYQMSDGNLFDVLTENLKNAGINLKPKPAEEIWQIINESAKDEVDSIIVLFPIFITLMKSNNYIIKDLSVRNSSLSDKFFKNRNNLFIQIIQPIYDRYELMLIEEKKEIDFNDMINKATDYVNTKRFSFPFKYIIIDEFQDISLGRYKLIKAIIEANSDCKLFCVGDDWQSIYRFSGSDIALFKDFERFFGFTVKSKIETTYRFNQPVIDTSSAFILKNPNQVKKRLKGIDAEIKTNFHIQYSTSADQNDGHALSGVFRQIVEKGNSTKCGVLVLGRYGFDINRIKDGDGINVVVRDQNSEREYSYHPDKLKSLRENQKIVIKYQVVLNGFLNQLEAEFLTIHKSKGLEADEVIIINCNTGRHGFPSEISDDPVLNLMLSEADQFNNGEERRLFYVAMTRARNNVYFIADSSYKSKFISELELEDFTTKLEKCPVCKTGDISLRKEGTAANGNKYKFYGCSNFLYGCDYTNQEWFNKSRVYN